MVLMELPEEAFKSDEATSKEEGSSELPFLNMARFLGEADLRIPTIYLDATPDGAILLEDLGDVLFLDKVDGQDTQANREWYFAAVDLLIDLHQHMWPMPEGCIAKQRSFDYDLLRWELSHYLEWGVEALQGRPIDPTVCEQLNRKFDELARVIAALPRGFVHRDYQSKNLMILGDTPSKANLAIIDFQDALIGPRVYDLVALLCDSYVDVVPSLKEKALRRYAEGMGLDFHTLKQEFLLVTVQRKLKDGGRFVFIDREKGNPAFLPYVSGSFGRVREALDQLPDYSSLRQNLAKIDPLAFGENIFP